MTPPQGQGLPQLDTAVAILAQVNLLLGGVPGIIAFGASLVQLLKKAGMSDEEAQTEVAKFIANVEGASTWNKEWLATHPRIPGA